MVGAIAWCRSMKNHHSPARVQGKGEGHAEEVAVDVTAVVETTETPALRKTNKEYPRLKGGKKLHLAITSTGADLSSPMDERFGRARYILIIDPETDAIQVIDNNDNLNAAQGAGIQTAQIVADHHVDWVITGHVGPKAYQALSRAKIKIGSGVQHTTCHDALEHWKNGGYEPLTEADVKSHWG